jgi:hypothetical protein
VPCAYLIIHAIGERVSAALYGTPVQRTDASGVSG